MSDTESQPEPQLGFPYCLAVQFQDMRLAQRVYTNVQAVIRRLACDLSVYRFLVDGVSYVAVLGTAPVESVQHQFEALLAPGERVELDEEVLQYLSRRRTQARTIGPWVEGHYPPF